MKLCCGKWFRSDEAYVEHFFVEHDRLMCHECNPSHHSIYTCSSSRKRIFCQASDSIEPKNRKVQAVKRSNNTVFVNDGEIPGPSKRLRDNTSIQSEIEASTQLFNQIRNDEQILRETKNRACETCKKTFKNSIELSQHFINEHGEIINQFKQFGWGQTDPSNRILFIPHSRVPQSLGVIHQYETNPNRFDCGAEIGLREYWQKISDDLDVKMKLELKNNKNYKFYCSANLGFMRRKPDGEIERITAGHSSTNQTILHQNQTWRAIHIVFLEFDSKIDQFTQQGSNWVLEFIEDFSVIFSSYKAFKGGSYMKIPEELKLYDNAKTLININNGDDQKCFLWSILAKIKPTPPRKNINKRQVKHYKTEAYTNLVNMKGIKYPISERDILRFEKNNPNISLTIVGLDITKELTKKKKVPKKVNIPSDKEGKKELAYKYLGKRAFLFHNTGIEKEHHVDLLMMQDDRSTAHFVLIDKLANLFKHPSSHNAGSICRNCLQTFRTAYSFHEHKEYCKNVESMKTRFPPNKSKVEFDNYKRTLKTPFVAYADFESFLVKYDPNNPEEMERDRIKKDFKFTTSEETISSKSKNRKVNYHKVCGYSIICVDHEGKIFQSIVKRANTDDEDIGLAFIKDLADIKQNVSDKVEEFQILAKEALKEFDDLDLFLEYEERDDYKCCFCKEEFVHASQITNDGSKMDKRRKQRLPVRHHHHLSPYQYLGRAHSHCNLKARINYDLPVFIHNFGSYDCHFIIPALGNAQENGLIGNIQAIPKSTEKFLSIKMQLPKSTEKVDEDDKVKQKHRNDSHIVFLDSLGFTLKGLGTLVDVLRKDSKDNFKITEQEFKTEIEKAGSETLDLLLEKGAYPYNYMTSCKEFEGTSLPNIEEFYNDLTQEPMDKKKYAHAKKVWDTFNIKNLGEWHDLYVRLDVSLLADVMENLRKILFEKYNLDISHYFSLPMVSWDAVLKFSKVKLQLINDPTMHVWIESAIRGGYTSIGQIRTMEANNKYMGNLHDKNKPDNHILYIDANNLYGQAMSSSLPIGEYKWIDDSHITMLNQDRRNRFEEYLDQYNEDSNGGSFWEVKLVMPKQKHDFFNELPLAPSKRTVSDYQTSNYQQKLAELLNIKPAAYKTQKLIADLHDKDNYVLHYKVLKTYIKLGAKVEYIYRGLEFKQGKWMKGYIDENTKMRKESTSDFEKDFWKLLNNAAYGKTIEQVRNRERVNFVTTREKALEFNRKPTVKRVIPVKENLSIFVMRQISVYLNKPIAVGAAILDIAKNTMYEAHYNLKAIYKEKAILLYTDTDSLVYGIETEDVYKDMRDNEKMKDMFDMSKYNPDHPQFGQFHSDANKDVLGKFKDEFRNAIITHFTAARPKLYAIQKIEWKQNPTTKAWELKSDTYKKAKGVPRVCVKKNLTFDHYQKAVDENLETSVTAKAIRSKKHFVYTEEFEKKAINCFDTKSFFINKTYSYAFGHYKIQSHIENMII